MDLITIGHIIYDIRCYVEDFPTPDKTTFTKTEIQSSGGGSAANVAVGSVKLGLKAGVIGNVGTDEIGALLFRDLRLSRVDVSRVNVVKGKTGIAIILINKHAEVEVVEMIGMSEPIIDIDVDYIKTCKHLHMTGTNLDALEIASEAAKKSGVPVSFDPGRSKSHFGLQKLSKIINNCNYLIVNSTELKFITGENDVNAGIKKLKQEFDITCIIKSGKNPVLVAGKDTFEVEPFKVQAVDTIGAGDAFCAGFITYLLEKKSLKDSVRFANAVAAAKVQHVGAQSVPDRKEIEKMLKL
ncbi:carbohydrate kinase family protein [Candidatus Micrarchaeota archaeon]|nr:carbohydrate kinase family protein [Candidatus Micrarchaeota archaeon]